MASLEAFYLEKHKQQRERIRKLLQEGDGAVLEMPNHEVIFPANKKWLEKFGIRTDVTKDRDGRPICSIDIGQMLEKSADRIDSVTSRRGLFESESQER